MKTKVILKPMSIQVFQEHVNSIKYLASKEAIVTYLYQQIIGYQIGYIEYIYNEQTRELYIKDDYLLLNRLVELDLLDCPLKINEINHVEGTFTNSTLLPVIYIHPSIMKYKNDLYDELHGMVYFIEGDIHQSTSVIYFLNNEVIHINKHSRESKREFMNRLVTKVKNYISQRNYGNMNELRQLVIKQRNELFKSSIDDKENEIDEQISKQKELLHQLEEKNIELSNQLALLQADNDSLKQEVEAIEKYVIIPKGSIEEFYLDEQADILLDVLYQSIKNKDSELYDYIVSNNPTSNTRKEYLDGIFNVLRNDRGLSDTTCKALANYGIYLEHVTHVSVSFFHHPRYVSSISSTTSDKNGGRQFYRQFREYFF